MTGKSINFDDKKIGKSDFYKKNKKIFNIDDIDVDKILISKKEPYGKNNALKYFIGYNDDAIRPLFIRLPQMIFFMLKNLVKMQHCLLELIISSLKLQLQQNMGKS